MTIINSQSADGRVTIVACRVMEPEFEAVRKNHENVEILYLDQGLHRTPQKMAAQVQSLVDQAAETADRIVLGYGLCSNGIVGVEARQQGLIVPRCHDCIAFFLGSPKAYLDDFNSRPGTYYLTPGWIAERKDPLSIIRKEYEPRFGRETAEWVKREELKHYTHLVLINTGVAEVEPLRKIARENARFFNMQYVEIEGDSLEYFYKLVKGPYNSDEFIHLSPGDVVTQEMFFG
ncbi:MAG: DUF1638 domain-containing protein [Desulfobacterales bacterium]|nr:MAG: DUF1638 domain-containing protein [Desulfobacterales bacterium]